MMDVLLSLPILSYFLAPTVTSWSTSLNLLFFYMTWSTLVLSHSPVHIELFGTLGIRLVFWLLPSLVFLLFDTLLPSLAESIKYGGATALPPRNSRALAGILLLAILNLGLETAIEAGSSLGLTLLLGTPLFKTSTTLPLPWQIIKQLSWLYFSREVLTYYIHRSILHSSGSIRAPRWWSRNSNPAADSTSWIAKQHAYYAHSRRAPPFSLVLAADHPVPFLLHRFVPVFLPALAVRPHLLVYFLFVGLITFEETLTMSGYNIVPGIIMGGIARRNATHYYTGHSGSGSGNYGAWGLLDWGHGTSLGRHGNVMEDMRDEADKHILQERSEKTAKNTVGTLSSGVDNFKNGKIWGKKGRKE